MHLSRMLIALSVASLAACSSGRVPLGAWTELGEASGGTASAGASGSNNTGGAGAGGDAGGTAEDPLYRACRDAGTILASTPRGTSTAPTVTYTEWTWPASPDSLEWDVQVESDLRNDGYFWAHQFSFGDVHAFMGMQANGRYSRDPPDTGPPITTNMVLLATEEMPAAAALGDEMPPNAHYVNDSVTQWWTIHVRYEWKSCRSYHLRLWRESTEASGDSWYGASITDTEAGATTYLGHISVPTSWGPLAPKSTMWSNRIGWQALTTCNSAETGSAFFSTPTANDGTMRPESHASQFGENSCALSRIVEFSNGVRQELGVHP